MVLSVPEKLFPKLRSMNQLDALSLLGKVGKRQ